MVGPSFVGRYLDIKLHIWTLDCSGMEPYFHKHSTTLLEFYDSMSVSLLHFQLSFLIRPLTTTSMVASPSQRKYTPSLLQMRTVKLARPPIGPICYFLFISFNLLIRLLFYESMNNVTINFTPIVWPPSVYGFFLMKISDIYAILTSWGGGSIVLDHPKDLTVM